MAQVATVTARLVVQEGSETRSLAGSHSDKTILESNQWTIRVGNTTTQLSLYSMNTNAGPKAVFIESDKLISVHWNGTAGNGWTLRAGGFLCGVLTNVTGLYIENPAATTATVTVAVHLLSTT